MVFHIERAAAPNKFAVVHAAKRRVRPILFRALSYRDNVLVPQKRNRL